MSAGLIVADNNGTLVTVGQPADVLTSLAVSLLCMCDFAFFAESGMTVETLYTSRKE